MTETQEKPLQFPDDLSKSAFDQIAKFTEEHNDAVAQINAVKGDPVALRDSLRQTSKNKSAVAARKMVEDLKSQLADAEEALDSAIQPEFEAAHKDAEGSVSALEEEAKDKASKIRAAKTYMKATYDKWYEDNKVGDRLPKVDRLKGAGGTRTGGGGRRIRNFDIVTVINGETKQYENMSQVAKDLEVDTSDLQAGFFEAAGLGSDGELKNAPDTVKWAVEVGDGDNAKVVNFTATRKETQTTEESSEAQSDEAAA